MSTASSSVPPEALATPRYATDPVHAWMRAHPEQLVPYRGQQVAIDPARGVIASGPDIGVVIDQLDRMGIPRESDDVLITPVVF
jgi:hypothetical protein